MVMSFSPNDVAAPAWTIRPELPIDLDHIHELHREAFTGSVEAELVDAIRSGSDFIPELSLVAVTADDSVLGPIMLSRIGLQPDGATGTQIDVLALSPLAVLPPHQGRGIGAALMREALAIADEREEPMTVVLGLPAFYGRFGVAPAEDLGVSGPYEDAGDAFQVRPRPSIDPEELPTGTAIYPPT